MTVPTSSTRRRPRRGLRIAAGIASGAVLLTSGVAWAGVNRYAGDITHISIGGLTPGDGSSGHSDPMTILVVASDSRDGLSRTDTAALHLGHDNYGAPRTDTMMLVHIGADANAVSVVSLPRDTLATIPEFTDSKGKKHPAHQAKINAAYAEGGADLMVKTVHQMTGVDINHYIEINFNGFLTMVNAVDGVEVCLVKALKDKNSGLDLPAGRQTIRGAQALAYVRARYVDTTSDLGRMKRQQKFVASIVKKATSAGTLLNPLRLDAFLSALASSITADSGLGQAQLLDLADRLKSTNPANVAFLTVPLGPPAKVAGIGDVLVWDKTRATALFTSIRNDNPLVPIVASPGASTSPSTTPVVTVAPGTVRIAVFNGTSTKGLGTKAATDLAAVGFAIVGKASNAPTSVGATTVITYDPRYDQSAKTVAASIPGATLTAVTGLGRTIHVTVGTSYSGAQKVTVSTGSTATPTPSATGPRTAAVDTCA